MECNKDILNVVIGENSPIALRLDEAKPASLHLSAVEVNGQQMTFKPSSGTASCCCDADDECQPIHVHAIANVIRPTISVEPGRNNTFVDVKPGATPIRIDATQKVIRQFLNCVPNLYELNDVSQLGMRVRGAKDGSVLVYNETGELAGMWSAKTLEEIGFRGFTYKFVDELPDVSKQTMWCIYLVRKDHEESDDYTEYITIETESGYKWERIGGVSIDLSNYITKNDLDAYGDILKRDVESYTDSKADSILDLSNRYTDSATQSVKELAEHNIEVLNGIVNETKSHLEQVRSDLATTESNLRDLRADMGSETEKIYSYIDEENLVINNSIGKIQDGTDEKLTTWVGQRIDGRAETIEAAVAKLREGTDETMVSWVGTKISGAESRITTAYEAYVEGKGYATTTFVGQEIDGAKETIKTAIEKEVYGEGVTEIKTIGQMIDGSKDTMKNYVLQSQELIGEDGLLNRAINGAYTEWGIGSITSSVSSITEVLSEDGKIIDVVQRFSTINQTVGEINLTVGSLNNYAQILLNVDEDDKSNVTIKADKIYMLGDTIANYLKANEVEVTGKIIAKTGSLGGWTISENAIQSNRTGANTFLGSDGHLVNKETDSEGKLWTHWEFLSNGGGSLANGSISWSPYGDVKLKDVDINSALVSWNDDGTDKTTSLATLIEAVSQVLSMFELDDNGDIKTKSYYHDGSRVARGFYSESFVSTRGKSPTPPSGGGGLDWSELTTAGTQVIHESHIPQLDISKIGNISSASVDNAAKLGGVSAAFYATQSWVEGKGYRAGTAPASGAWWRGTPIVNTDGVMEVGKYLDFHHANNSTADYSVRFACPDTTGVTITLPSTTGTLALASDIPSLTGYATQSWVEGKGYQLASTAITTSNIGSQSVAYAADAGSLGSISAANYYHSGNSNKSDVDWTAGKLTANTIELKSAAIKLITGPHGETIDDYLNVHLTASSGSWAVINGVDSYSNPLLLVSRANGYVGVGTSSPAYPLDVASSNSVCLNMTSTGTQTSMQLSRSATNLWQISHRGTGESNALKFYHFNGAAWNNALSISADGNVTSLGEHTAFSSSDIRLKTDIRDFNALEALRSLGGYKAYRFNGLDGAEDTTTTRYGLIYQNVVKSEFGSLMAYKRENGYGALNYIKPDYINLIGASVLEVDNEVAALKKKVASLEAEIVELRRTR